MRLQIQRQILRIGAAAILGGLASGPLTTVAAQQAPTTQAERERMFYDIANYMGMLRSNYFRGVDEVEAIATAEYWGTGTVEVDGEPCRLTDYRASINYQTPGMRVNFTCTRADGDLHHEIQVVSGNFAWNEVGESGAGLVPGEGTAVPAMVAVNERLARLWSGPQGWVKAARMGGENTLMTVEGGKHVLTFPIPAVPGGTAKATLSDNYQAERVEARVGSTVTEWTYSNYADHNEEGDKLDAFFAGRIIEKRGDSTILDLTLVNTNISNNYVVMPVPQSVRQASR